jgi:hypothetical protein
LVIEVSFAGYDRPRAALAYKTDGTAQNHRSRAHFFGTQKKPAGGAALVAGSLIY